MAFNLSRKLDQSVKINIDTYPLERTNEFKYLGVTLDDKLKFDSHIKSIKQSIVSRMFTLKKVKYLLGSKEALLLYKSKILPYFDIGSLYYDSANADQVRCLQTLQNKCVRTIFGKNTGLSGDELHKKGRLLNTRTRRKMTLLKYAHQLSYHNCNLKDHNTRSLRSNRRILLKQKMAKKTKYEKCFIYQSIKLWNNLPEEIKQLRLMFNFTTRIKKELLLEKINFPE